MIIIDGKNLIAGRLATYVAKQALLGNQIAIINTEKVIITGDKNKVLHHEREKLARGYPYKGPFIQRNEDKFLKRLIRGMLPHKQERGKLALKRIKCYISTPEELKDKESITVPNADIKKTQTLKYIYLSELCKLMGKKQ
jgi:large subunit ribosomal protein L13